MQLACKKQTARLYISTGGFVKKIDGQDPRPLNMAVMRWRVA